MKLHYAPGTYTIACWTALKWAGADYGMERVQLRTDECKEISPLRAIPALDIREDAVRGELAVILRYVLYKYPERDLGADESPGDRSQFNEITALIVGDFHSAFKALFVPADSTTSTDKAEIDKIRQKSFEAIGKMMTYLSRLIGDGGHVHKNKKTVLDAYVYVLTRWSEFTPKSWKEYPNINRVSKAIGKDEVVQEIMKKSRE